MQVTFWSQIPIWKRVFFALFLRELRSQFNDKLGMSWGFLEPFIFIFGLSFLRSLISGGVVHDLPILIFMLIGMIAIQSFLQPFNKISNSFGKNKPLYAFRQVQPIAGLLITGFVEYIVKIVVILLATLALYLMEIPLQINNPLTIILLFHGLWVMTISMGCLLGVITAFIPEIKKVVGILTRPLFFISCVFFSLQDIPQEYWHWFTWNPLVHYIELARYSWLESYGSAGVSLSYPLTFTFVTFFFAVSMYHITWKGLLSR